MRTIRLSDPFPRGTPEQKLEWGSSAWAADSCLVEWSRFERDWLEPRAAARAHQGALRWSAHPVWLRLGLGVAAVAAGGVLLNFFV